MREGFASISPREISCMTRSGTSASASPLRTISRINCGGFRRHLEIRKARGEARDAQDAHRVLDKRRTDVAQNAGVKIALALIRIDQRAVLVERHRVDRQIAPRQILLERHVGRGVRHESFVAGRRLALGARERVFLVCFGMQKHRKILADRPVAERRHLLGRRADHDPIAVGFQRGVQTRPSDGAYCLASDRVRSRRLDTLSRFGPYVSIVSGSALAAAIHCCIAGSANTFSEYAASNGESLTPYVAKRVTTGA